MCLVGVYDVSYDSQCVQSRKVRNKHNDPKYRATQKDHIRIQYMFKNTY